MQDETHFDIDRFILSEIDSVPHLEALLLLWNSRPQPWSTEDMAKALFVSPAEAGLVLQDLTRRQFLSARSESGIVYTYDPEPERDRLMKQLDRTYRTELIRITRMIHSRASASVREFAKAFRIRKEQQ